jgi:hypothetical protein
VRVIDVVRRHLKPANAARLMALDGLAPGSARQFRPPNRA